MAFSLLKLFPLPKNMRSACKKAHGYETITQCSSRCSASLEVRIYSASIVREVFLFYREPNYPQRSLFHNSIPINKTGKYTHRQNSFTGENLRRFFPSLALVCADSNRCISEHISVWDKITFFQRYKDLFIGDTLHCVQYVWSENSNNNILGATPLFHPYSSEGVQQGMANMSRDSVSHNQQHSSSNRAKGLLGRWNPPLHWISYWK